MVYLSAAVIIQKMFHKNRTVANGITLIGMSLGNMSGPLVMEYMAEKYGWSGGLLIMSGIMSHLVPACLMFPSFHIEQRNVQLKINTMDKTGSNKIMKSNHKSTLWLCKRCDFLLMKNCSFVLYCISFMGFIFNYYSFIDHMIGRGTTYGVSRTKGAYLLSSIAIGGFITRITCSFVGNMKCSNCLVIYSMGLFLGMLSTFITTFAKEFTGMLLCTITHGVHLGWYLLLLDKVKKNCLNFRVNFN